MRVNGRTIRRLRRQLGWVQRVLAERSNLSLGTIKSAERGRVGIASLKKIAGALGTTVASLQRGNR